MRTCDVVLGELRLGTGLSEAFYANLLNLPRVPSPTAVETVAFIDRHHTTVRGAGVGWADIQVILAAKVAGALLYTEDNDMRALWSALGFRLADGGPRAR